jgi:hypothetical protein
MIAARSDEERDHDREQDIPADEQDQRERLHAGQPRQDRARIPAIAGFAGQAGASAA